MAALFYIGMNPFLLLGHHRPARPSYDKDGGAIRHGRLFEQAEGTDVVPLLKQNISRSGEPCSLPVIKTRFPVPFEKKHTFLRILRNSDQCPCQFRFRWSINPNALP